MSDWQDGDLVDVFHLEDGSAIVTRYPTGSDQEAINAREILAGAKRGAFRELDAWRINCDTHKAEILARNFVGRDDDGTERTWLLVAPMSLKGRKVPALAVSHPKGDREPALPLLAQCKRCKTTYLIYAGETVAREIGSPTQGEVNGN